MLLLLAVLACNGSNNTPPPAPVEAPAPPKPTPDVLFARGLYEKVLEEAQKSIIEKPEDGMAWDLLELSAIRAGKASEQVDKLAVDQALGGQTVRHHLLRGTLALAAKRPSDALSSATALLPTSEGDGAWLVAAAVRQGAPAPAGLSPAVTSLLALQADSKLAWDASVDSLPGWHVALLRGTLKLQRGDKAGALAEATAAEAGGATAREAVLALRLGASTPDEGWNATVAAVKATTASDPAGAAILLDKGLDSAVNTWQEKAAVDLAAEVRKAATDAKSTYGDAMGALVVSRVHLYMGELLTALDDANIAVAQPALKESASWQLVFVHAALGESLEVEKLISSLPEARRPAAQDLVKAMRGGSVSLPSPGLEGNEAALQALLGAGWQADPRPARTAALAAPAPQLRLWAELSLDRKKLSFQDSPAAKAEAGVRSFLAGGSVSSIETNDHPEAAAWKHLLGKEPATGTSGGVSAWPRARAALAAGDLPTAVREYGTLAISVPAWRCGPWEPLLALEGPLPEELQVENGLLSGASDPLPMATLMHGWQHRVSMYRSLWKDGVSPVPNATNDTVRRTVWDAAASHRAAQIAWIAGKGPAPATTAAALATAENKAGLVNFQPPGLTSLRNNLSRAALLSLRQLPSGVEVLVLTEEGGRVVNMPGRFAEDVEKLLQTLPSGQAASTGNRIRSTLLDPLMPDLLLGLGRYLIVGTGALGALPVADLPEQEDAQRYLMEIRSVGNYATFDQVIPSNDVPGDSNGEMLAIVGSPQEADVLRRAFMKAKVYTATEATLANWRENAPKATYLHLGQLPTTPDGG
ncbi:MAG TPA: hypothetical protein PLA94_14850, partial [Myxococcota bacterium]|nr:hypothetical protein [Myxococcota bacterium]